jgi:hypothetical protein
VPKWPTNTPRNWSIRLIEPVKSTLAPQKSNIDIIKRSNAN